MKNTCIKLLVISLFSITGFIYSQSLELAETESIKFIFSEFKSTQSKVIIESKTAKKQDNTLKNSSLETNTKSNDHGFILCWYCQDANIKIWLCDNQNNIILNDNNDDNKIKKKDCFNEKSNLKTDKKFVLKKNMQFSIIWVKVNGLNVSLIKLGLVV